MNSIFSKPRQSGFTLVELMIALLISLFMIGGLLSVFNSNQQTSRAKNNLDQAQEAFRFASYAISRSVRLAGSNPNDGAFLKPNEPDELRIIFFNPIINNDFMIVDCLGQPIISTDIVENRFFIENDALRCEDGNGNTQTLITGVKSMIVHYGAPGAAKWIANSEYQLATNIDDDDWPSVSSARITLEMANSGLVGQFVVTARSHIVSVNSGM